MEIHTNNEQQPTQEWLDALWKKLLEEQGAVTYPCAPVSLDPNGYPFRGYSLQGQKNEGAPLDRWHSFFDFIDPLISFEQRIRAVLQVLLYPRLSCRTVVYVREAPRLTVRSIIEDGSVLDIQYNFYARLSVRYVEN